MSLFFKKPHRADGDMTLSERKFEAENTAEKMKRRCLMSITR